MDLIRLRAVTSRLRKIAASIVNDLDEILPDDLNLHRKPRGRASIISPENFELIHQLLIDEYDFPKGSAYTRPLAIKAVSILRTQKSAIETARIKEAPPYGTVTVMFGIESEFLKNQIEEKLASDDNENSIVAFTYTDYENELTKIDPSDDDEVEGEFNERDHRSYLPQTKPAGTPGRPQSPFTQMLVRVRNRVDPKLNNNVLRDLIVNRGKRFFPKWQEHGMKLEVIEQALLEECRELQSEQDATATAAHQKELDDRERYWEVKLLAAFLSKSPHFVSLRELQDQFDPERRDAIQTWLAETNQLKHQVAEQLRNRTLSEKDFSEMLFEIFKRNLEGSERETSFAPEPVFGADEVTRTIKSFVTQTSNKTY